MDLISQCNRVLGTSRQSTLTIDRYNRLTIVSGTCGGGKNTLLAGVMSNYDSYDNHIIYTETRWCDNKQLSIHANYCSELQGFDIETVVGLIKETPAENIFIEQYHNNFGEWDKPLKDMKTLCNTADLLDKNITICVHKRREV